MVRHMKKKVIKRRIKWKAVLKIFFLLFCVALIFLYLFFVKTRRIVITGNSRVSDHEIITTSGFKNYPYLFRISTKAIKSRILTIEEIHEVKIHKSLFGTLTIEVEEAKPLFFNRNTNKLVLSNQKTTTFSRVSNVIEDETTVLLN